MCSIKYVAADLGKITTDRSYYSYTCGPELLSDLTDVGYSYIEGSIFSCGYYTIDLEESSMRN